MPSVVSNILVLWGLVSAEGVASSAPEPAPVVAPGAASSEAGDSGADARVAAQATLATGNRLLKEGQVADAIAAYQRAQILYPPAAPKIEFNIAKAEEARGDEPAAAAAFERFLAQSLEIPPEFREEARNELHRLSAALGTLQLAEKRPGLAVVVDGEVHGKTPLDGGLWVRPGHHVVTLEQGDRVMFRDDVDVQGGATMRITVTIGAAPPLDPLAPAPPAAGSSASPLLLSRPLGSEAAPSAGGDEGGASRPIWKRWWFWTAAGAAVVAGTTLLLLGASHSDCPSHTSCMSVSIPPSP